MALVKHFVPVSRGFSSCSCLCAKRLGKKTRVVFDERFPISAKHVNEKRKGGSKEMAEKLALHVVQPTGYTDKRNYRFVKKKEMIPEFIVPDLKKFVLTPYVSYNAPPIEQKEITPEELFDVHYGDKIRSDFNEGKVTADVDLKDIEQLESLKS